MWHIKNTPLQDLSNLQKKRFYFRLAIKGDKKAKLLYLYYRKVLSEV